MAIWRQIVLIFLAASGAFAQAPDRAYRNLAALDAVRPGQATPIVSVLGFSSPGDWGPPKIFRYDATNALATNAIRRATLLGTGRWVHDWDGDVRAFGVMADNASDDTVALQAALDAAKGTNWFPLVSARPASLGKRVFLPTGTMLVSQLLLTDQVVLQGSAYGSMIRQIAGTSGKALVLSSNIVGWTIRDVTFDGNRDNGVTNCPIFEMRGTQYGLLGTRMERCVFQNGSTNGMFISIGGALSTFEDIVVQACSGYGIFIERMSDSKMSKLDVRFCREGGFRQNSGANITLSDSKFWANRLGDDNLTTTYVLPRAATLGADQAAVMFGGNGFMVRNVEIQENGSIGMRIGDLTYQCTSSSFEGMLIDGNGGFDTNASPSVQADYRRDGLQFVNYYGVHFRGVFDDFRARQGKGRQNRGLVFIGTIPTYTSNTVANGSTPLFNDDWYRIGDVSGGAVFTNFQYSLATKKNAVGDVFQAQTYDYSNPVPQSWGTNGTLYAANDLASVDAVIYNQYQQNDGTGTGYSIGTAGPLCEFRIRTPDKIYHKSQGMEWDPSLGLRIEDGFGAAHYWKVNGDYENHAAAPVWSVFNGNTASGLRLRVLSTNAAGVSVLRVQHNGTNVLQLNEEYAANTNSTWLNLLAGQSLVQIRASTNDSARTGFRSLMVTNN